jgi:hypothetical protein
MSEILSAVERMLHDRRHIRADAEFEALRAERDSLAVTAESAQDDMEILYALGTIAAAQRDAARERVRVLTEALAAVRDAYYDTTYADLAVAMERARSVLAAVPSEPTCPDCGSPVRAQFGVACQTMHHAWHDTMPASVPSGALWSCSHCGPHPDSTANWCAAGCGSDYNRMTSMPREES